MEEVVEVGVILMGEEVAGAEVVAILMVMDSFMTRVACPLETTIAEEGKLVEVLA